MLPLARAGVAVYSPHTAFDNCAGGINDILCRRLGVVNPVPLRPRDSRGSASSSSSFPTPISAKVSDALFAAGAGIIGQYTECSFRLAGKGTFFATDATNPTVGQKGRREDVDEWRLEVVVPERLVAPVVGAMRKAHSYEEPAFDVYPLKPGPRGGEGRIGELANPATLGELADRAKRELKAASVQVVGDLSRSVRKVAVACGAAGEFLVDSIRSNADVFLTGELRFHDALTARDVRYRDHSARPLRDGAARGGGTRREAGRRLAGGRRVGQPESSAIRWQRCNENPLHFWARSGIARKPGKDARGER